MKPSRIHAVDHVHLEVPPGIEEAMRWFYGEVGHLEEIGADEETVALAGFRSARLELRLQVVARPNIDPVNVRLTLLVPSLAEATQQLDERKVRYFPTTSFSFKDRRLATFDPAGHRVELKQAWPEAPL